MKERTKGILNSFLIATLAIAGVILLVYFTKGRTAVEEGYRSPTYFAMDTTLEITIKELPEETSKDISRRAYLRVKQLERKTSRFLAESEVSAINQNAGKSPVKVSPETFKMLEDSLRLSELTGGAFDITVAPLMELYGFYSHDYKVPTQQEIEKTKNLIGWNFIKLEKETRKVMLAKPGVQIDLGGVAKGYAVQELIGLLKSWGVKSGLVNFGGTIGVLSLNPKTPSWTIGIRHPRGKPGEIAGTLSMKYGFISSSGDYERYFIHNKTRYFHILDPHTGRCPEGVISASVVGPDGTVADALSTAIVVLGRAKGTQLLSKIPKYEAVVIEKDRKISYTDGMKKKFTLEIGERLK